MRMFPERIMQVKVEDPPRVWMASSLRLAAWVGGPEMGRRFRTLAALSRPEFSF